MIGPESLAVPAIPTLSEAQAGISPGLRWVGRETLGSAKGGQAGGRGSPSGEHPTLSCGVWGGGRLGVRPEGKGTSRAQVLSPVGALAPGGACWEEQV